MMRWLWRLLQGFPVLLQVAGISLVGAMVYQSWEAAHTVEAALQSSIEGQKRLRDVLWLNMLLQRTGVLVEQSCREKSADELDRAEKILASAATFARDEGVQPRSVPLADEVRQLEMLTAQVGACRSPKGAESLPLLIAHIEGLGESLNDHESGQWYKLNEHNRVLGTNLAAYHRRLGVIYLLFVTYIGLLAWISERKRQAEARIQEQQAQMVASSKMATLGEMAGGVAHEINNPLAIIKSNAEAMLLDLSRGKSDETHIRKRALKIDGTVERIAKIINSLRTFARDASLDPLLEVPLSAVIEDVLEMCRQRLRSQSVDLRVEMPDEELVMRCRPSEVTQVLLNLLSNAHDAIMQLPEGQRWIRLAAERNGDEIEISVTDAGTGIAQELQERIFQPFFTTKPIGRGTGLGLSISYSIMKNHGGDLLLDTSSVNTRFVVRMRAASRFAAAA